jgi:hypothetical protein
MARTELTVNQSSCTAEDVRRQPLWCSPPKKDSLRGAMIANGAMKLHLRRLRSEAESPQRKCAVTKLLDASEAITRSLSWLAPGTHGSLRASSGACERIMMIWTRAKADVARELGLRWPEPGVQTRGRNDEADSKNRQHSRAIPVPPKDLPLRRRALRRRP